MLDCHGQRRSAVVQFLLLDSRTLIVHGGRSIKDGC